MGDEDSNSDSDDAAPESEPLLDGQIITNDKDTNSSSNNE
jgi:hypothetical protein